MRRTITAVRSVSVLSNCTVIPVWDDGHDVDGEWITGLVEGVPMEAHRNRVSNKIIWLDDLGERMQSIYKVRLLKSPGETPRFIKMDGVLFKVTDSNERPKRLFFKYIVEEQFS